MLSELRHLAVGTQGGAFLFRPREVAEIWEMIAYGLYGRSVTSLALGANGGVFVALERGMLCHTETWESWRTLYQGLAYPDVYSVTIDPRTQKLYAGTAPAAVFTSTDGGQRWTSSGETSILSARNGWTNPSPPHRPCLFRLIAHPRKANCLVGGVQAGGVIVSFDGGRTWRNRKAGLSGQLTDLRLHPDQPERLYATNLLGFHRSDDLGLTWRSLNKGLPYIEAQALCVHGIDPNRLLMAVGHPNEEQSIIFKSDNGGENWEVACAELPISEGQTVTCLESGGGVYFAGTLDGKVFGSRDGRQWHLVRAELPPVQALLWVGEVPSRRRLPICSQKDNS